MYLRVALFRRGLTERQRLEGMGGLGVQAEVVHRGGIPFAGPVGPNPLHIVATDGRRKSGGGPNLGGSAIAITIVPDPNANEGFYRENILPKLRELGVGEPTVTYYEIRSVHVGASFP